MRDNCPAPQAYPPAPGPPRLMTIAEAWEAVEAAHENLRPPLQALAFDAGNRSYWQQEMARTRRIASEAKRDYLAAIAAAGMEWTGPEPMELQSPGDYGPDAPEWRKAKQ